MPLIVSCGMSDIAEVHHALDVIGTYDGFPTILMLCTSEYPTPPENVNILKLKSLEASFPGLILGFSDHTQGSTAAIMAVAMGATVFETHFTLDHDLSGPDHWFSKNPEELSHWCRSIRDAYEMKGSAVVRPTKKELEMRTLARRSVVALKDINEGDTFTLENIGLRRPGNGLSPTFMNDILGKKASDNIDSGNSFGLWRLGNMNAESLLGIKENPFHPLVMINGNPEIGDNVYIGAFSELYCKGI